MSDAEETPVVVGRRVVKPLLNRRSTLGLLAATHKNATTFNKVWNAAPKAPIFTRKPTVSILKDGTERKVVRTYRIGSSHQLNTLASSAAHVAAERAGRLGADLRIDQEIEDPRAPVHLNQSKGFQLLVEHAIIAYVQTVVHRAEGLQQAMAIKKRLCARAIELAANAVDDQVLAPGGLKTFILKAPKAPKKTKAAIQKAKKSKSTKAAGAGKKAKAKKAAAAAPASDDEA
jgi:hypothetical protein